MNTQEPRSRPNSGAGKDGISRPGTVADDGDPREQSTPLMLTPRNWTAARTSVDESPVYAPVLFPMTALIKGEGDDSPAGKITRRAPHRSLTRAEAVNKDRSRTRRVTH